MIQFNDTNQISPQNELVTSRFTFRKITWGKITKEYFLQQESLNIKDLNKSTYNKLFRLGTFMKRVVWLKKIRKK